MNESSRLHRFILCQALPVTATALAVICVCAFLCGCMNGGRGAGADGGPVLRGRIVSAWLRLLPGAGQTRLTSAEEDVLTRTLEHARFITYDWGHLAPSPGPRKTYCIQLQCESGMSDVFFLDTGEIIDVTISTALRQELGALVRRAALRINPQ